MVACLWLITANFIGFFPSKRGHWPAAYGLIAVGVPILIWVFMENPWWMGLIILVAAGSILRWPVIFLLRRLGILSQKPSKDDTA